MGVSSKSPVALRKNTMVGLSTVCEARRISTPMLANKKAETDSSNKPVITERDKAGEIEMGEEVKTNACSLYTQQYKSKASGV